MPIQLWVLLAPAGVLLLCGLYTVGRHRRWPSFSVGMILCDIFFLVCLVIVNAQLGVLTQGKSPSAGISVFEQSVERSAKAVLQLPGSEACCRQAVSLLQGILVILLLVTVGTLIAECYRIFSSPPIPEKVSVQEMRIKEDRFPIRHYRGDPAEGERDDEYENKL